ncbi:MAG: DEAD/DEAH box helicase family protein [Planctomycetota bacterium]
MSFQLSDFLWEPQRRTLERVMYELNEGSSRVILQSPTGTGKSQMSLELLRWADSLGVGGNFYVNRKLLVTQTADRFQDGGLWMGIRAAEYEDRFDDDAPFQVTSAQSEDARVYKSGRWQMHDVGEGGLVIVDESHMQKSKVMKNILDWYETQGARIVLLTATPVNMSKWAEQIIVSGKLKEWRDVGALVMVHPYTISQPDLSKVKKNNVGEYMMEAEKKKQFVQSIVGDVLSSYEELNQGGPAMMYAPGVAESKWLTSEFRKRGHDFVHVDATSAIIDGETHKLDRSVWEDIVGMVKDGTKQGLSSRFKLREGIDIPAADHCILATPIGSLSSFLQIVGRIMRASPSTNKTHGILQDHGGAYHNHGSPNHDRDWDSLWQLSDHAASTMHMDAMKEGQANEPIRCPKCGGERAAGPKCPHCGHEHKQSERRIIMEDGSVKLVEGKLVKRTRRVTKHNTAQLWTQMYYGFKNKKVERSFAQMEAFFKKEYGYRPERNLPFMPRRVIDWKRKVFEVPMKDLIGSTKEKIN